MFVGHSSDRQLKGTIIFIYGKQLLTDRLCVAASNTPLSPATDSLLTDTLLVLAPDRLCPTPELLSLMGLSGGGGGRGGGGCG